MGDQQEKATKLKIKFEADLVAAGQKLVQMEEERVQATADKKVLEGENVVIKKDMEDIELAIQKLEQEKTNRDHTIRHLNDEIANQDEVINKLDSELQTINGDMDEMANELALSEDKAKKAMVDAARLADELRTEQEVAQTFEKDKKLLDCQAKDLQARLDTAEADALKGGKKAMNKMDTRIRELQSELDAESRRFADAAKNLRRSERRIKELAFAGDEDRKNHERMQGLIDSLQGKIKSYKKQIEEAEEIAALNLAKFRQAQNNLGDASERADMNDQALAKLKAKGRASIGPM